MQHHRKSCASSREFTFIIFLSFFETLKRLKNWEIRERKKFRDYSKDAEREDERRRETVNGC